MARPCSVCSHPEAVAVNEALIVERRAKRRVAREYLLSEAAIYRHLEHIPELLVKASRAQEIADADRLLEDLDRIRQSAFDLLDKAERSHDWRARVAAIQQCRENVRILGELRGKLQTQGTTNILVQSPEWIELKAVIVGALEPFPAARSAVVLALEEANNGAA